MLKTSLGLLAACSFVFASPDGDKQHAYKTAVGVVLNGSTETVFADTVEEALVDELKTNPRFSYEDELHEEAKKWAKQTRFVIGNGRLEEVKPFVQSFLFPSIGRKVDFAVFTEVQPAERDGMKNHRLVFVLVNGRTNDVLKMHVEKDLDPKNLRSFAVATKRAMAEVIKGIPFGATVVKRDGYRVILDRGTPEVRKGMQLPVFTIETDQKGNSTSFVETGVVLVTRAEKNLAFGKVLADRRPYEITEMNKVWLGKGPFYAPPSAVALLEPNREPASESFGSILEVGIGRPAIGSVQMDFGLPAVTLNNARGSGVEYSSGTIFYPQANVAGELRFTRNWYAEGSLSLGSSTVKGHTTSSNLNSTLSQVRFFGGYRFSPFTKSELPSLYLKLGWMSYGYQVDPSSPPLKFTSAYYSGMSVGAGADFGFDPRVEAGVFMNVMVLPGVEEHPQPSGTLNSASSWELGARVLYHLSRNMDAHARFVYQSSGITFQEQDTQPGKPITASHAARGVYVGASYRF